VLTALTVLNDVDYMSVIYVGYTCEISAFGVTRPTDDYSITP